ncbi:hypothetical protein L195_g025392 [Trifolium pratense]|uniref:IMP dehydrogenase/GMP reductase n=1 Tax=Trifolium pratense TaxID=57577 RepID=A0A2K3NGC1_TRIPR|nr:hypothetical protein L195_g025392 [Trifolium pratense]
MYLPERVLHQFGFTHTIPRFPSQSANPVTTRAEISLHFVHYLDMVLTPEHRGLAVIRPWDAAYGYMRWYFRISHPYINPLPAGKKRRSL